jgi:hypothetical protein
MPRGMNRKEITTAKTDMNSFVRTPSTITETENTIPNKIALYTPEKKHIVEYSRMYP